MYNLWQLFDNNAMLSVIWLENNQISSIPNGIFDNLPILEVLDITLSFPFFMLDDKLFASLSSSCTLTFYGGQISCDDINNFDGI